MSVLYDEWALSLPSEWFPVVTSSEGSGEAPPPPAFPWALTQTVLARLAHPLQRLDCLPPLELSLWQRRVNSGVKLYVAPGDGVGAVAVALDGGLGICAVVGEGGGPLGPGTRGDAAVCDPQCWIKLFPSPADGRLGAWSGDGRLFAAVIAGAHTLQGPSPPSSPAPSLHDLCDTDRVVVLDKEAGWRVVLTLTQADFGVTGAPVSLAGLAFRIASCGKDSCVELLTVWQDHAVRRLHVCVPPPVTVCDEEEEDAEEEEGPPAPAPPPPSAYSTHSPKGMGNGVALPYGLLNVSHLFTHLSCADGSRDFLLLAGRAGTRFVMTLWRVWDEYPWYTRLPGGMREAPESVGAIGGDAVTLGLGAAPSTHTPLTSLLNPLTLTAQVK